MLLRRLAALASLGLFSAGLAHAQDVTVGDPVWTGSGPAPEVMPQARLGRGLRPPFPREARTSGEIGYVIVTRQIDAEGRSLYLGAIGSEIIYERAVETAFEDWELKPARHEGRAVPAGFWIAVLFNPASAAKEGPEATARLLFAAPLRVPGKFLRASRERPVVRATLDVTAAGGVARVELEARSDPQLVAAVRDGLKQWRFAPARQNGQPVPARVSLPLVLFSRSSNVNPGATGTIPSVVRQVAPHYPRAMRDSHLEGEVRVQFVVDTHGDVQDAEVLVSNNPGFEDAALEAVRQWKFKPGLVDGEPVATHMVVPVVFRIQGGYASDVFGVDPGDQSALPDEYRYDTPPRIRGAVLPVYPYDLLSERVTGSARVGFVIDSRGRVVVAQVIKASRPEFGLALVAAVESFQFDPALRSGRAVQTLLRQDQEFSLDMLNAASMANPAGSDASVRDDWALADRLRKHPDQLAGAGTLDRPLHPISTRAPVYPLSLYGKVARGSALIEIVVDEDGRARLPRIVSASDPAFGYAAVQAIASWRFDPPEAHGRAVTTHVEVPFDFAVK